MRKIIQYSAIISFIILMIMVYVKKDVFFQSDEQYFNSLVKNHSERKFNGIISDKFIDERNNYYKNIVIKMERDETDTLMLNFEKSEFYDFLKIGDSLIKERNTLKINLKRSNLDTILWFQFGNVKNFEKSKIYDSIKSLR